MRNSGDRLAWFEYNGQTVVRTKRSHGNKEQPVNLIRQQLKLNEKQLAGLIKCDVERYGETVISMQVSGSFTANPQDARDWLTERADYHERRERWIRRYLARCREYSLSELFATAT